MDTKMNANRVLSELLAGPRGAGLAGGVAGGLASSLLLSKAGRRLGKRALELGGLAVIAGLGYTAWRRYQEGRGAGPAATARGAADLPAGFLPPPTQPQALDSLGRVLLQAMIAAARADAKLDGDERRALFEHVARIELPETERADLYAALERPVEVQTLVAAATTQERAVEIYAASLLAIEVDTPAERGYLAMLAAALGLPDSLIAHIHREAGVAQPELEARLPA
jgi:uncharacterized membrane protein YebE (DUF533 family)